MDTISREEFDRLKRNVASLSTQISSIEYGEVIPERITSGVVSASLTFEDGFVQTKSRNLGSVTVGLISKALNPQFPNDAAGAVLYDETGLLAWYLIPAAGSTGAVMGFHDGTRVRAALSANSTTGGVIVFYDSSGGVQMSLVPSSATHFAFTAQGITDGEATLRGGDSNGYAGFAIENTLYFRANAQTVTNVASKDVNPSANNTLNLGSATRAWKEVFAYTYTTVSDERTKKDIAEMNSSLSKVNALRPVEYRYKTPDPTDTDDISIPDAGNGKKKKPKTEPKQEPRIMNKRYGFLAQEVAQVIPEITKDCNDTKKIATINPMDLIPFLVGAIQELTKRVELLENK